MGKTIEISKKTAILIISVVVGLLFAVFGLVYILYKKIKKSKSSESGAELHPKSGSDSKPHFDINAQYLLGTKESVENVKSSASQENPVTFLVGHPGCGHCSDAIPAFVAAGKENTGKTVFVVDASTIGDSLLTQLEINAFPTFVRYTSSSEKSSYPLQAPRTIEALSEFIKNGNTS